jgi:hypothetical protein
MLCNTPEKNVDAFFLTAIENATQGVAAPGLASMLDLDGDGNPLDDILEMARKAIT